MTNTDKVVRRSFWGAAAFYILVAFEFFYMAGPFATFFYSAYAPALNFLNDNPTLSWLNRFFLPHAARQTASILINAHEIIGAGLAIGGFLAFVVGACQVYYHKLAKKGAVTGGIYNRVRHPQYAAFIVCSFGMMLLWPRYIVAVLFTTMAFFYYLLAKVEERECARKFGQMYTDYLSRTHMFLPFGIPHLPRLSAQGGKRIAALTSIYLATLALVLLLAWGLNALTLNSLYATYSEDSANVALCELNAEQIDDLIQIASTDSSVRALLDAAGKRKAINYVLPTEWSAAEVPMNGVQLTRGHQSPSNYDHDRYKVIFTLSDLDEDSGFTGKDILGNTRQREPIVEVWVNLADLSVEKVLDIPDHIRYEGIPVALY